MNRTSCNTYEYSANENFSTWFINRKEWVCSICNVVVAYNGDYFTNEADVIYGHMIRSHSRRKSNGWDRRKNNPFLFQGRKLRFCLNSLIQNKGT